MTITYDPETNTATQVESGLSVRFVRWGERIRDQDVYFEVTWRGQTKEFEATFLGSAHRIRELYPDLSVSERWSLNIDEVNEVKFITDHIGIDVSNAIADDPEFGKNFVETWWHVAAGPHFSMKTVVEFAPFFFRTDGHWEYGR